MAEGPGLMGSQDAENYDRGYTIYSDDPAKQALINPNRNRQTSTPTSAIKSQKAASPSAATTQPTAAQQQDYREFQQYQQFKQLPANSAEYQRFRDWQEWKQYQQWRDSESENR